MKTDTPRPILLKDYRPPSYLISHVDLNVSLHPTCTRVRARSKVRPNPAVAKPGPLKLDGELLELVSVAIDGRLLGPKEYRKSERELTIAKTPDGAFEIDITTTCNPQANKALTGLYLSKGIYCTQC
jgi:aminopeptidase N